MRYIKFLIGSLVAIIMLFGMNSLSVSACTPTATDSANPVIYTLEDRVNHANWVMIGTVIGGLERGGVITEAEIEVERYLKGEGSAIIQISGFGHSTACLVTVSVGDRYIFFAEGNGDEAFRASYLGNRSPIVSTTEENIERVIAVTNQSLAPDPLPISIQIERTIRDHTFWFIIAIIVINIAFLWGTLVLGRRHNRRKTKAKRS